MESPAVPVKALSIPLSIIFLTISLSILKRSVSISPVISLAIPFPILNGFASIFLIISLVIPIFIMESPAVPVKAPSISLIFLLTTSIISFRRFTAFPLIRMDMMWLCFFMAVIKNNFFLYDMFLLLDITHIFLNISR